MYQIFIATLWVIVGCMITCSLFAIYLWYIRREIRILRQETEELKANIEDFRVALEAFNNELAQF